MIRHRRGSLGGHGPLAGRGALAWLLLLAAWLPLLALIPSLWAPAGAAPAGLGSPAMLGRSLAVAGGAAVLALSLGVPAALLLGGTDLPARRSLRGLILAPLALPPYIATIGWLHLLGPRGPWGTWLGSALGFQGPFMGFLSAWGAIWVLGLWSYPLVALVLLGVLERVSSELVEGAWLAGGWPAVLRGVAWPACAKALGGAGLVVILLALTDFGVASFLGVPVYTAEIMLRFGAFYDVGAGVRSLLPLAGLAAGGYLVLRRLTVGYDMPPLHADPRATRRAALGFWRWPAALLVLLPILLAVGAPLLALVSHAPALTDYFIAWHTARRQLLNTALYGPLAATLALAMAWPLARAVARGTECVSRLVQTVTLGQLAVPGLALGMGLIRLWNRAGPLGWVYGSPLMVIMVGVLRGLPLAALALALAWRQLPGEVEEAALIAGAAPGALRRRVLAPLLRPGIAAAWGLACYRAMTDLEATVLVHAPGDDTLAVRIYTLQHDGQAEHVAALALTLVALTLVVALGARLLWRAGSDA